MDLVKLNILRLDNLKFFVVDECDYILQNVEMRNDIFSVFLKTPPNKQVMMFSGTMSDESKTRCRKFL